MSVTNPGYNQQRPTVKPQYKIVPKRFDDHIPYSEEAEAAVLGSVLLQPELFPLVADILVFGDFHLIKHGYIWQAMVRLYEAAEGIDQLTVAEKLRSEGFLDQIGGPSYLIYLINAAPNALHGEYYAKLVQRLSVRRRMLIAADEIRALATDESVDIEIASTQAEDRLRLATYRGLSRTDQHIMPVLSTVMDEIEGRMSGALPDPRTPTGYRDLDRLLGVSDGDRAVGGFPRGEVTLLAARPGMGKSALVGGIAVNQARARIPVGVISSEMSKEQFVYRMVQAECGVSAERAATGLLKQEEWSRWVESSGRLQSVPLNLDYRPGLTLQQMRGYVARAKNEWGIQSLFIDGLYTMGSDDGDSDPDRVKLYGRIMYGLQALAKKYDISVCITHQLSRSVERRSDKRPILSDLRDSGEIEQAAFIVAFIYRDVVYNEDTEFPNQAEIIVAKHRNGRTGSINLYFDGDLTRFMNQDIRKIDLGETEERPGFDPAKL